MTGDRWLLRTTEGNEARLEDAPYSSNAVRVSIAKAGSTAPHDIQVNQSGISIARDGRYVFTLRARADAPRNISFGIAQAHAPWASLGLFRTVALSSEWRSFEETFVGVEGGERARIHFDLGGSDSSVELSAVSLRNLAEGRSIEPILDGRDNRTAQKILDESPVPVGAIRFGSFLRVAPISRDWGWDRGLPIDRFYVERFLASHSTDVRGSVLEAGDDSYARRFGGSRIAGVDILDLAERSRRATIVGDLADAPQIPSSSFDCIILTQTLQFIFDVRSAIRTLHRILKPGGVLLATFPGISHTNDSEWGGHWCWNFTPVSAKRLFHEAFEPARVEIETYGNVLSAISFLHGLAAEELTNEILDYAEPGYEVTIAVKASKSGADG